MFNLFRSRDRMVRIFLTAILLVVALSMLIYLIPSYGNGPAGPDSVVAEVGKDAITTHDIQLDVQNLIRARQVPTDMVSVYLPQIIEEMITYRSLIYQAHRLGIQVTDAQTSEAIRQARPDLFPGGKFVGRDTYSAMLAQQNLTIPEFESDIANRVLVTRLTDIVLEGTEVTSAEVEQEYRRRNDKIKIEYVKITPEQFKDAVKVTPEEIKAYFDKNHAQFAIAEKRSLAVLILDPAKIEQSVQPSDADLQHAYDTEKDQFRIPERIQARYILIKSGATPAEDAKAKAKADDILKQLRGGADFAEQAKKYSQDPGTAAKGGDLGWLIRGQAEKSFDEVAFSLKPKQISEVSKTQSGYEIIECLDHQQAHLKTFDEARAQLVDELRKQRAGDLMEQLADKATATLKKEPVEQVAKDLGLAPPIVAENLMVGQPVPGVGQNPDFEQAIAGLQKGGVSQPVSLTGNRVAIAVITGITPTHPATFEEAQPKIRPLIEGQKTAQIAEQRAGDLVKKVNEMNGDLAKAAKSMGLEVKAPPAFDRRGSIEGLASAAYFVGGFNKPDGTILGPTPIPGGRAIAKVVAHEPADMSLFPAQRANLVRELRAQKAQERNEIFRAGLREQLIKEGKIKIHKNVIDQLVASFRS